MRVPGSRRVLLAVVVTAVVLACGAAAAVAVGGGIVRVQSTTISEPDYTMIAHRTVTDGHTIGAIETMTQIYGHGTAEKSLTRTLTIGMPVPPGDAQPRPLTATRVTTSGRVSR